MSELRERALRPPFWTEEQELGAWRASVRPPAPSPRRVVLAIAALSVALACLAMVVVRWSPENGVIAIALLFLASLLPSLFVAERMTRPNAVSIEVSPAGLDIRTGGLSFRAPLDDIEDVRFHFETVRPELHVQCKGKLPRRIPFPPMSERSAEAMTTRLRSALNTGGRSLHHDYRGRLPGVRSGVEAAERPDQRP